MYELTRGRTTVLHLPRPAHRPRGLWGLSRRFWALFVLGSALVMLDSFETMAALAWTPVPGHPGLLVRHANELNPIGSALAAASPWLLPVFHLLEIGVFLGDVLDAHPRFGGAAYCAPTAQSSARPPGGASRRGVGPPHPLARPPGDGAHGGRGGHSQRAGHRLTQIRVDASSLSAILTSAIAPQTLRRRPLAGTIGSRTGAPAGDWR